MKSAIHGLRQPLVAEIARFTESSALPFDVEDSVVGAAYAARRCVTKPPLPRSARDRRNTAMSYGLRDGFQRRNALREIGICGLESAAREGGALE